ncbi:hypothetical protein ACFL2R_03530 [Patescibacteria group bacterium]
MIKEIYNRIIGEKKVQEKTIFFDLSSGEKKKVIKKAIHMANKEQKDLMDRVAKKGVSLS